MTMILRVCLLLTILVFAQGAQTLAHSPAPTAARGTPPLAALPSPPSPSPHPASLGLGPQGTALAKNTADDPIYDEQAGITFTQSFTSLAYNVTAVAQADADGYGPAYLLNGLTDAGYWYQVGISYDWPNMGGGYTPGFGFSYQVYNPRATSIYPASGGAGVDTFTGKVDSGDLVLLTLVIADGEVQMVAKDWNTGAIAETSYNAEGASTFVGDPSRVTNAEGFFTGLMTEWYHVQPYKGNEGKVVFSNQAVALTSAWMWMDEFDSDDTSESIFSATTPIPTTYSDAQTVYPFSSNGLTEYSSAHQFIVGGLTEAASKVTLAQGSSASSQVAGDFTAIYLLGGTQQTAALTAPTTMVIEADPGSTITVTGNSSGDLERWVFDSAGDAVTFTAGNNVSYAYYDVVAEKVSYAVAGQGTAGQQLPSAPTLTYQEAPTVPSASYVPATTSVTLSTAPQTIWVIRDSLAQPTETIAGAPGERWSVGAAQNFAASSYMALTDPIRFYHQYLLSLGFSVVGGGTPPAPGFNSTALGVPSSVALSSNSTGWFDAGAPFAFTGTLLAPPSSGERWVGVPGTTQGTVSSANQPADVKYQNQYMVDLLTNDASGGSVSPASGWFDAASTVQAAASTSAGWQFESWTGSGGGAYSGTAASPVVKVDGPISETATFFAQVVVETDAGSTVSLSYSGAGAAGEGAVTTTTAAVPSGSTRTVFVSPGSSVSLTAAPSSPIYSFGSWKGAANSTQQTVSLGVSSPLSIRATSSYNVPVLGAIGGGVAALVAAIALGLRALRRRDADAAGVLASPARQQP